MTIRKVELVGGPFDGEVCSVKAGRDSVFKREGGKTYVYLDQKDGNDKFELECILNDSDENNPS